MSLAYRKLQNESFRKCKNLFFFTFKSSTSLKLQVKNLKSSFFTTQILGLTSTPNTIIKVVLKTRKHRRTEKRNTNAERKTQEEKKNRNTESKRRNKKKRNKKTKTKI